MKNCTWKKIICFFAAAFEKIRKCFSFNTCKVEIVLTLQPHNGWSLFKTNLDKYGYRDSDGINLKCISPNDSELHGVEYFMEAEEFIYDVAIVKLNEREYRLINKFGENINTRYEEHHNETYIKPLENGLIYYQRRVYQHKGVYNTELFLYNRCGQLVYDGVLSDIQVLPDGYIKIKNSDGDAVITPDGKFVIPFCKTNIKLNEFLFKVLSVDGMCGVFDSLSQKMIVPYGDYGNLLYIETEQLFLCSQYKKIGTERKWSVVDMKGNTISSYDTDKIEILNEKVLLITHCDGKGSSKQEVFSFYGDLIVPPLYDEILCSISGNEFLARKDNPNDILDCSYDLYNLEGLVKSFDKCDYKYVGYHTIGGIWLYEGTKRGIGAYSMDKEYTSKVACPAYIELTREFENKIRCSIVDMQNKVIIPDDYIFIGEVRDDSHKLVGFKANMSMPKINDYVVFNLEGEEIRKGNLKEEREIDDYLELMLPGYKSDIHRAIEEDIFFQDDFLDDIYEDDLY